MWLDQLERDAIQAQETEGNLAQQYQVCMRVCVWVCVQYKLGTLGTDAPIISLISGITLWGSDGSRHIFSQSGLFHPASGYFPYSTACGISPFSFAHYSEESGNLRPQRGTAFRGN